MHNKGETLPIDGTTMVVISVHKVGAKAQMVGCTKFLNIHRIFIARQEHGSWLPRPLLKTWETFSELTGSGLDFLTFFIDLRPSRRLGEL